MDSEIRGKSSIALGLALGLLAFVSGLDQAWAEPPIKSQQDAACREVARSRVFSTPDPQNLGPYEVGRQIYHQCMKSSGGSDKRSIRRRRRR